MVSADNVILFDFNTAGGVFVVDKPFGRNSPFEMVDMRCVGIQCRRGCLWVMIIELVDLTDDNIEILKLREHTCI